MGWLAGRHAGSEGRRNGKEGVGKPGAEWREKKGSFDGRMTCAVRRGGHK